MTAPDEIRRFPIESVGVHPDYTHVITLTAADGARVHYLQTDIGDLIPGRIMVTTAPGAAYRVHLFLPLAPWAAPSVLEVEPA